jgi:hypothetical protein
MDLQFLINHVNEAVNNAYNNTSKITEDILNIEGMTGNKTRHLYNNICNLYTNATYVEVGTWKGSSFISAMYKNTSINGISIDNWSEFGGPKDEFYKNINTYLNNNEKVNIIDKNCWDIHMNDLGKSIDVFMYDGGHSYEEQKKAITYYHSFFSKYCIIIIDDWTCDWVRVKEGTMDGITEMNLKIHLSIEIPLVNTNNHHTGGDTFWNGCGIFVCERTDI